MYRFFLASLMTLCLFAIAPETAEADLGFNRLLANTPGRCWRIINRDLNDKERAHSGIMLKVLSVTNNGTTGDALTFELTFKFDYVDGIGWDESKTRTFSGTGVITTIGNSRVNFDLLLEIDSTLTLPASGFYHPGSSTADHDDSLVIALPVIPPVFWEGLEVEPYDPCWNYLEDSGSL